MHEPEIARLTRQDRGLGKLDRRGTLLMLAFVLAGVSFFVWRDHQEAKVGRREVVAALASLGFREVEVRRVWSAMTACGRGKIAFRWQAATARGEACSGLHTSTQVRIKP